MMVSRTLWSLVIVGGSWGVITPAAAWAAPHPKAEVQHAARARLSSLVGKTTQSKASIKEAGFYGTLTPGAVNAFNHRLDNYVHHHGLTPPPIPPILRQQPLPPAVERTVLNRQSFILELYYEKAQRRASGIAGGVRFGEPGEPAGFHNATPVTPVKAINIFSFFPVFRIPS